MATPLGSTNQSHIHGPEQVIGMPGMFWQMSSVPEVIETHPEVPLGLTICGHIALQVGA